MHPNPAVEAVTTAFREKLAPDERQKHMLATYVWLRRFVYCIGYGLPVVLGIAGWFVYQHPEASMSAYYYTSVRDIFVGGLFATGALLFSYKGFSDAEDTWLDAAAVLLVIVALVPTEAPGCTQDCGGLSIHGAAAVSFFVCIGVVVVRYSGMTLPLLPDAKKRDSFRKIYRVLGWGMPVLPAVAWILQSIKVSEWIFFVELAGVWVFSTYWLVKSRELKLSGGDERAFKGADLPSPRESAQAGTVPAT